MTSEAQTATLLGPPAELESLERGRWLDRPPTDPAVAYLEAEHWSGTTSSPTWQAARLSHAVYLYCETGTQWAAVAKYYTVKTGRDALRHAEGERERLQQAAAAVHGDATTSNFVFPSPDEVVAIDWERLWVTDPAFDLGRLMAEISHSITRWGGNESEAQYYAQLLASAYGGALPPGADAGALVSRATFYHASSALRIARNGWVSRLDRMGLVAQAMALLARLDD